MSEQPTNQSATITFRPGTIDDSYAVFCIFEETLADLVRRFGAASSMSWDDPAALEAMWQERQSFYKHLARTAEHFWLAEQGGQIIGFSRSIVRGNVRQLTELFVRPGVQSKGVGRGLLHRAMPSGGNRHRSIIATADFRAQALYLRVRTYPRVPIYYFGRQPERVTMSSDLGIQGISYSPANLATLARLDEKILGYSRGVDHGWLLEDRRGYFYLRDGQPVGYAYVGKASGPFVLLDNRDFPAVLAHAEGAAASLGYGHFGLEVPMTNQPAVDHLLGRGFTINSFMVLLMTNGPFGRFENIIVTAPPFFL